jgi:adenylosuccinate lyase
MNFSKLFAISPIDGRYLDHVQELQALFSEFGLMRLRLYIEIEWLITLADEKTIREIPPLKLAEKKFLHNLLHNFNHEDAARVKQLEHTTKHDVKAIEYFLKEKMATSRKLKPYLGFVHFGAASEDINNLAYACALATANQKIIIPKLSNLVNKLCALAKTHAKTPMLARTHGQPATPTTVGKELANFASRLVQQTDAVFETHLYGKFNGAVGSLNALYVAYPKTNWRRITENFVTSFCLANNRYTTQIEPHDSLARLAHNMMRINTILIGLARDIWGYISLDYFQLKMREQEVGSSTMPHKINPIDFENAEGNLGIANSLLEHFANKLPISRWQRDLSDSTVMRNIGVAFAHSLLAYDSLLNGLDKIAVNKKLLSADLNNHWEVLGEAIQVTMRRYGIEDSYEQLKALTRGKKTDKHTLHEFINKLVIPKDAKKILLELTPENYLGKASELAQEI